MSNLIQIFSQHSNWPEVKRIIVTLNQGGFKAYLAGGCVRDAILKQTPKDFDIATSARPDSILKLFPNSNRQGKAFGVVAVFSKDRPVEIATFRKDGPYTDGRHPEYVKFMSDREDALRRDFTINALFYDLKTDQVIDHVGGREDLQKKIIKTVGDPEKRFQEDHLRILRAIRFSIQLNFEIDVLTGKTLLEMKDTLLKISRERVYEECLKILKTGNFAKALSAFKELNLINHFWKTLQIRDWRFCLNFWDQTAPSNLTNKNSVFLWTLAFYPLLIQEEKEILNTRGKWKPAFSKGLKEWKFPLAVIRAMNDILYFSCCILNLKKVSFGKKLRILNSGSSEIVLFLSRKYLKNKKLNTDIIDKIEKEFIVRSSNGKLREPLINGNDLKNLGVPENRNMTNILEYLYDLQLEQNIKEKSKLIKIAGSLYIDPV